MSYTDEQIRKKLKRLMHREGMTQSQFADKLGKTQPQISDILRGKVKISDNLIDDIYKAFPSLSKDWLSESETNMYEGEDTKSYPQDTRPRLPKTFAEGNIEVIPEEDYADYLETL